MWFIGLVVFVIKMYCIVLVKLSCYVLCWGEVVCGKW